MEPNKDAAAAAAAKAPESTSVDAVIDPKATIKIEGQEFELDTAWAKEDKTLTLVLRPHFASIENSKITREVKEGKLIVSIVKNAGFKGE